MSIIYKLIIVVLIIASFPTIVSARSNKDAEAVITLKNGVPCFSYPRDEEVIKWKYSFANLDVTERVSYGGGGWSIFISHPDRLGLQEPDSKRTCIVYGDSRSGTKVVTPATPLRFDTPYEVFILVSTRYPGVHSERKFSSDFCLTHDKKGEILLVGAEWNNKTARSECLKPGESPKRGFWQKLFGK